MTQRFEVSEHAKPDRFGMWWVWDMEDNALPKIVGRFWEKQEAKDYAARLNSESEDRDN